MATKWHHLQQSQGEALWLDALSRRPWKRTHATGSLKQEVGWGPRPRGFNPKGKVRAIQEVIVGLWRKLLPKTRHSGAQKEEAELPWSKGGAAWRHLTLNAGKQVEGQSKMDQRQTGLMEGARNDVWSEQEGRNQCTPALAVEVHLETLEVKRGIQEVVSLPLNQCQCR